MKLSDPEDPSLRESDVSMSFEPYATLGAALCTKTSKFCGEWLSDIFEVELDRERCLELRSRSQVLPYFVHNEHLGNRSSHFFFLLLPRFGYPLCTLHTEYRKGAYLHWRQPVTVL